MAINLHVHSKNGMTLALYWRELDMVGGPTGNWYIYTGFIKVQGHCNMLTLFLAEQTIYLAHTNYLF